MSAVSFSKSLKNFIEHSIASRDTDRIPLPHHFDHGLPIQVQPDHVVYGIVAYIMNPGFDSLHDEDARELVEKQIINIENCNERD